MAVDAAGLLPPAWGTAGRALWALGCAVLVGALGWSVRDNLTGSRAATGEAKADRRRVDRFASAFVPVALAYLVAGAVLPVVAAVGAPTGPLPPPGRRTRTCWPPGPPRSCFWRSASGCSRGSSWSPLAARSSPSSSRPARSGRSCWPRSSAAVRGSAPGAPPRRSRWSGSRPRTSTCIARSDRRRVGLYGLLVAALAAVAVAGLGLYTAATGVTVGVADAHGRVALLGFLGTAVAGVSYQFYPPAVASLPGVDDRTAGAALTLLAVSVGLESGGLVAGVDPAVAAGRVAALAGALVHAAVILAVFRARRSRGRG